MPIIKNGKNISAIYKGNTPIAKIYKGANVVWKKGLLPIEYQQVEYIESTGTQYFTLPYIASQNTNSQGTFQITSTSTAAILFGARKQSAAADFYGFNWGGGSPYKFVNSYYFGKTTTKAIDTNIHTFTKQAGVLTLDGVQLDINTTSPGTWNTVYNVVVFGCNTGGKVGLIPTARIFGLQISEDLPMFHLIPCYRKSDGAVGMYDIVNNVFYTNQGTGEFLKGASVSAIIPSEYQQIEYIEATETQYIDTNFCPDSNTSIEIEVLIKTATPSKNNYVFGVNNADNSKRFALNLFYSANSLELGVYPRFSINASQSLKTINFGQWYKYSIKKGSYYVDNELLVSFSETFGKNENSLYINANNISPEAVNTSHIGNSKIKICKIWDNNVLVRHLIPCYRKSDEEVGMYDIVNNVFYTNKGTGKFTRGGNV